MGKWFSRKLGPELHALLTGETDTASHAFREELTLCRRTVVRPVVFEGLRGLAAVAVVADLPRPAGIGGIAVVGARSVDEPSDGDVELIEAMSADSCSVAMGPRLRAVVSMPTPSGLSRCGRAP